MEKALLQIDLNPSQRDFVRFLWFQKPGNIDSENLKYNELNELRFCRVLFGVSLAKWLSVRLRTR